MASDDFWVDPGSDFGGPHHSFIELQLAPALTRLTQAFEKETGFPIEVYRRTDFPKVDLVNGVQRIGVTASEGFWMRYTYEFSHELGHVLTKLGSCSALRISRNLWLPKTSRSAVRRFTLSSSGFTRRCSARR